jgi:hypothetical protein
MYKYRFSIDVFLRNFLLFLLQEEFYGREVILADRDMVETQSGKNFIDIKSCIYIKFIFWKIYNQIITCK